MGGHLFLPWARQTIVFESCVLFAQPLEMRKEHLFGRRNGGSVTVNYICCPFNGQINIRRSQHRICWAAGMDLWARRWVRTVILAHTARCCCRGRLCPGCPPVHPLSCCPQDARRPGSPAGGPAVPALTFLASPRAEVNYYPEMPYFPAV